MDLYLQMGHGMQSSILELLEKWNGGTAILSPRNIKSEEKLVEFAEKLHKINGAESMIDPQLFSTNKPSKNLEKYSYFRACDGNLYENWKSVTIELLKLNRRANTDKVILPSVYAERINSDWKGLHKNITDFAAEQSDVRIYQTVALDEEILKNMDNIDAIYSSVQNWNVEGVYLVISHPNNDYLVDRPLWLMNLLQLVAGLKRTGKKVIVGYANHQLLALATTKCDAICSGNFLNTRRFRCDTFEETEDDAISRRSKWYYAAQALSEFKITALDIPSQKGELDVIKSPYQDDHYCDILFAGGIPSEVNYSETNSFLHYLHSLKQQVKYISRETFDDTYSAYWQYLQTAENLLKGLQNIGIYGSVPGNDRDFSDIFSTNYSALAGYKDGMGFLMKMEWDRI